MDALDANQLNEVYMISATAVHKTENMQHPTMLVRTLTIR